MSPRLTLLRAGKPLADPARQRAILESHQSIEGLPSFAASVRESLSEDLCATAIEILQVNVGKLCNQTCGHCHVDAGPDRREIMTREIAEACLRVLANTDISVLDITGGAPELNPNFRWLVREARKLGRRVIDRCNLTILLAAGQEDLIDFLAENEVEIIASLPCYLEQNCDAQRGAGVFQRSIEALRRLNQKGYGRSDAHRPLTLVYNPIGPALPPPQETLESDYRRELRSRYGVEFDRLITITNMPISRFLDDLLNSGRFEDYMNTLRGAFHPETVTGLMCRHTLSVDWRGFLYDCDFNQMLDLRVNATRPQHIHDFELSLLNNRPIVTGPHCFGCTAGSGSGCQGAIRTTAELSSESGSNDE